MHGMDAEKDQRPNVLVEVPHGATMTAHFDALCQQLRGDLPSDLLDYFCVNTDVGAFEYGRAVAELLLGLMPTRMVMLMRCLLPRTFVDCNRLVRPPGDQASEMTPAIGPYVRDAEDQALLHRLHATYVEVVQAAYREVCGNGGFALTPHSYAPRSVSIEAVDDNIASALRAAWARDRVNSWPLRPEVDLITRGVDGKELAPEEMPQALIAAFAKIGITAHQCATYTLHPETLGYTWATMYPGQVLCMEVRRDFLVHEWRPFEVMRVDPDKCRRVARPIAEYIDQWLRARSR